MRREKPSIQITALEDMLLRQFARPGCELLLKNLVRAHIGPRIYRLARQAKWMERKRATA